MDHVNKICKSIARSKENTIFVGGVSFEKHGLKHTAQDIDIVVQDLTGLEFLGPIFEYTTTSKFSKSGKRAHIETSKGILIDIFIEAELPEHNLLDGLKCETLDSLRNHFKALQQEVLGTHWSASIENKLKLLR